MEKLPPSLRSIELSDMAFVEKGYAKLLGEMRDKSVWQSRPLAERPKLEIKVHRRHGPILTYYVSVGSAAGRFLYGDAGGLEESLNPFGDDESSNNAVEGRGAMDRTYFDTSFERPHDLNGSNLPFQLPVSGLVQ